MGILIRKLLGILEKLQLQRIWKHL